MARLTAEKMRVMKQFQDGSPIEVSSDGKTWTLIPKGNEPQWDWANLKYRRQPTAYPKMEAKLVANLTKYLKSTKKLLDRYGYSARIYESSYSVRILRDFQDVDYDQVIFYITPEYTEVSEDTEIPSDYRLFEMVANIIELLRGIDK
jgi:hypothetical protein